MGGGAGVSIHGRFRVATDNTVSSTNTSQVTFCFICYILFTFTRWVLGGRPEKLDVTSQFGICLFEFLLNVDPY